MVGPDDLLQVMLYQTQVYLDALRALNVLIATVAAGLGALVLVAALREVRERRRERLYDWTFSDDPPTVPPPNEGS
jgi:hypothetical protein